MSRAASAGSRVGVVRAGSVGAGSCCLAIIAATAAFPAERCNPSMLDKSTAGGPPIEARLGDAAASSCPRRTAGRVVGLSRVSPNSMSACLGAQTSSDCNGTPEGPCWSAVGDPEDSSDLSWPSGSASSLHGHSPAGIGPHRCTVTRLETARLPAMRCRASNCTASRGRATDGVSIGVRCLAGASTGSAVDHACRAKDISTPRSSSNIMPCHLSSGARKGSQTGKPGAPVPIRPRPTAAEQGFRAPLWRLAEPVRGGDLLALLTYRAEPVETPPDSRDARPGVTRGQEDLITPPARPGAAGARWPEALHKVLKRRGRAHRGRPIRRRAEAP